MYVYVFLYVLITAHKRDTKYDCRIGLRARNNDIPKRALEEKEAVAMMAATLTASAFAMASQTAVPTNVYIDV